MKVVGHSSTTHQGTVAPPMNNDLGHPSGGEVTPQPGNRAGPAPSPVPSDHAAGAVTAAPAAEGTAPVPGATDPTAATDQQGAAPAPQDASSSFKEVLYIASVAGAGLGFALSEGLPFGVRALIGAGAAAAIFHSPTFVSDVMRPFWDPFHNVGPVMVGLLASPFMAAYWLLERLYWPSVYLARTLIILAITLVLFGFGIAIADGLINPIELFWIAAVVLVVAVLF